MAVGTTPELRVRAQRWDCYGERGSDRVLVHVPGESAPRTLSPTEAREIATRLLVAATKAEGPRPAVEG